MNLSDSFREDCGKLEGDFLLHALYYLLNVVLCNWYTYLESEYKQFGARIWKEDWEGTTKKKKLEGNITITKEVIFKKVCY